jgi:hypothetical protein
VAAVSSGWEEDLTPHDSWTDSMDHSRSDGMDHHFIPHDRVPVDFPPAVDDLDPAPIKSKPLVPAPGVFPPAPAAEPPRWAPAVSNPVRLRSHGSMHRLRAAAAGQLLSQQVAPPTYYPTSYYGATGEPTYGLSCDDCDNLQLVEASSEENDENTVLISKY